MKKLSFFFAALFCVVSMSARTLYLNPADGFAEGGCRYAIYFYDNDGDGWADMSQVATDPSIYKVEIDDKYSSVIFCRMNGSTTDNIWANKWDQTKNLTIEEGKNLCTTGAKDAADEYKCPGTWSAYTEPVPATFTVKFKKPAFWGKVYIYAWNYGANTAQWPGTELTPDEEGFCSHTFENACPSFLFNAGDGQPQTVDITGVVADKVYKLGNKNNADAKKYDVAETEVGHIEYVLDGGELDIQTNDDLYNMFMPYYNEYFEAARGYALITNVAGFMYTQGAGQDDRLLFINEDSEYKWLGDYLKDNCSTLTDNASETAWRFTVGGFFACTANPANGLGDWTVAGQPESWLPVYEATANLTLPKHVYGVDFTLPTLKKDGYIFKGWTNQWGTATTVIYKNTVSGKYTAQWEKSTATALENAQADEVTVRKVIENGQLYIIRNGEKYTATGVLVK